MCYLEVESKGRSGVVLVWNIKVKVKKGEIRNKSGNQRIVSVLFGILCEFE